MKKVYGGSDPLDEPTNVASDKPELTMEEADAAVYGRINIPESGNIVAKPIALDDIEPDLTQPRRAIPVRVRGEFDGNPDDIPGILGLWHKQAEKAAGFEIDLLRLLVGAPEPAANGDERNPVVGEYLELIALAASIHRDGLANPITVSAQGGGYVIETGERRLLAHHILSHYVDFPRYSKIAARVVDRADVWRQAAENGARRPLNAVGMARQLALLIMDMYRNDPGEKFMAYREYVYPGECDRKFYAQVGNGNTHPVKRGMGQRVLDVTGLSGMEAVRKYRALLNIPDEVWMQADDENKPEGWIRAILDSMKPQPVTEPNNTVPFGTVQVNPVTQPQHETAEKPHSVTRPIMPRDKVWMKATLHDWQAEVLWTVESINGQGLASLFFIDESGNQKKAYQYTTHLRRDEPEPVVASAPEAAPVLPEMAVTDMPGSIMENQHMWNSGRLYQVGDEMNHLSGAPVVIQGFCHDGQTTFAYVTVMAEDGAYDSCCPLTELVKPAPVVGSAEPESQPRSQPVARPAPAPSPFHQPVKNADVPAVADNNRVLAEEFGAEELLKQLLSLAELKKDKAMRETLDYLLTVTPALVRQQSADSGMTEYQAKVMEAKEQFYQFVTTLLADVYRFMERVLEEAG